MKITQEQRVINYMRQFGSITTKDAFNDLGITRLSAKIFNLKKQGYEIKDDFEQGKNRYGETTNFKRYYLADIVSENKNHITNIGGNL